jgi:hypothetical protein
MTDKEPKYGTIAWCAKQEAARKTKAPAARVASVVETPAVTFGETFTTTTPIIEEQTSVARVISSVKAGKRR